MEIFYFSWTTALQARHSIPERHSENWRNKTQTEMRDALKHPTVVTGYLEGSASSLICLVWLETPNQSLNPPSLRISPRNLILGGEIICYN